MTERRKSPPRRFPRPDELRAWVPRREELQTEVDRYGRALFTALSDPEALLNGLRAARAFRRAVELGARSGPRDPRVRAAAREAETAALTAVREVLGTLLDQLGGPAAPAPGGEEKAGTDLVEVKVERPAEPRAPPRTRRRRR